MAPINRRTFLKAAGYNPLRREGLMKRETKERKESAWFDKKYRRLFISTVYLHVTKVTICALNSVMCYSLVVPSAVHMNLNIENIKFFLGS